MDRDVKLFLQVKLLRISLFGTLQVMRFPREKEGESPDKDDLV